MGGPAIEGTVEGKITAGKIFRRKNPCIAQMPAQALQSHSFQFFDRPVREFLFAQFPVDLLHLGGRIDQDKIVIAVRRRVSCLSPRSNAHVNGGVLGKLPAFEQIVKFLLVVTAEKDVVMAELFKTPVHAQEQNEAG